jgi:hypothetical protein
MDSYDVFMFVMAILFVIIQLLLINYLLRLEKIGCECAMDWRRNFMMFYMGVTIVHVMALTLVPRNLIPLVQTSVSVLGVMNVILTLQYVGRLKREKCQCSESVYKEIITLVAIFNAVMYMLLLVIVLYMIFSLGMSSSKAAAVSSKKNISIRPLFKKKK